MINDFIDDDIILVGRKNSLEQPDTKCFILVDDQKNVLFHEISHIIATTKYKIPYLYT